MTAPLKLRGQKFGYLIVTKRSGRHQDQTYWHCRCTFGSPKCLQHIVVYGGSLRRGATTKCRACGDYVAGIKKRTKNASGRKFGYLTVISFVEVTKYSTVWECRCACGNLVKRKWAALVSKNAQTCGHSCKYSRLRGRPTTVSMRINSIINGKRECKLSRNHIRRLIVQACHYCGWNGPPLENCCYNGVDRIDSSKPYTRGNVVPCCKYCNIAKNNLPLSEFLTFVKDIYNRRIACVT